MTREENTKWLWEQVRKYAWVAATSVLMIVTVLIGSLIYWRYTVYMGEVNIGSQPSLIITDKSQASKVIAYFLKRSDVCIHDFNPGTLFLPISIAISAIVAGLSAYRILPNKEISPIPEGKPTEGKLAEGKQVEPSTNPSNVNSGLISSIAATIAALTLISSNMSTYYGTTKERLEQARVCKASLSALELDLSVEPEDGKSWDKNTWIKNLQVIFDKYPHILFSQRVDKKPLTTLSGEKTPPPKPTATPTVPAVGVPNTPATPQ